MRSGSRSSGYWNTAARLLRSERAGQHDHLYRHHGVAGTTYRYQVITYNAAGSRNSGTVTVRATGVPPTAPTSLAATAVAATTTRDTVTLTWVDNSNNETGFTIQRSASSAFTGVTTATAPAKAGTGTTVTFNQTGLRKATTYWYRVAATGAGGAVSAWSNAVSITTP